MEEKDMALMLIADDNPQLLNILRSRLEKENRV